VRNQVSKEVKLVSNANSGSVAKKRKAVRRSYTLGQKIAFGFAGAAVFVGGLGVGNLVNATETEPVVLEPAQMPTVDNGFCEIAAATCALFLPDDADGEQPTIEFSPAAYTA